MIDTSIACGRNIYNRKYPPFVAIAIHKVGLNEWEREGGILNKQLCKRNAGLLARIHEKHSVKRCMSTVVENEVYKIYRNREHRS